MSTPIALAQEATLQGDVTLEGPDKESARIWLGQNVASVLTGAYKGTGIITTGRDIGIYVQRDGKSVGTIRLDVGMLLVAAIAGFERIERENA